MFFVISGFLLYRPYATAAFGGRPPPRLLAFWSRRFARVFPAYWLALFAVVVIFRQYTIGSPGELVMFATLTEGYRSGYEFFAVGVAWTLVVEVSFYVVLPAIAWVLRRAGGFQAQLAGLGVLGAVGVASRACWSWFPSPMLAQVAVVFTLTVAAATISYVLLERPINRWVRGARRAR